MLRSYRQIILDEAQYGGLPLAYWPLDEITGTVATDAMTLARGTTNNGTYTGGYTLGAAGPIGHEASLGVSLDSTSGCVAVAHSTTINPTGAMTIEGWVNFHANPAATDAIFAKGYDGSNTQFYMEILENSATDRVFRFSTYQPNTLVTGTTNIHNRTNEWMHVAGVITGADYFIYLNGVQDGTLSSIVLPKATTIQFAIGAIDIFGLGRFAPMKAAHVALYGYAVAANRIKAHYLCGVNGVRQAA